MKFVREELFKGKPYIIFKVSEVRQIRVPKNSLTAEQKKLLPNEDKK
jgi:hypothetical protein